MINFNDGIEKLNKYLGSEKKTTILYNDELYMIKFPDPIREKNNALSYMNNQYSEHIGCSIFKECGFNVQETLLGTYTDKKGTEKIVVGCKDFTQDGTKLYEFSKLINALYEIETKSNMDISTVKTVIDSNDLIKNKSEILNDFWDMFVMDALIGNADRHHDNWGIAEKDNEISFAPIYDCGSSLGALLDDIKMEELLDNPVDFKNKEYNAMSCFLSEGKRIFYHEIFKNMPQELSDAVKRIFPKINMENIKKIINSTETMTDIRKTYLTKSLETRHEQILLSSYNRLIKQISSKNEKQVN